MFLEVGALQTKKDSVRKSFLEAIQSQVATQKIIEMGDIQNMPYWDSRELKNRFYDKRVSLPCISPDMMHDVKLGRCHTVNLDGIYNHLS